MRPSTGRRSGEVLGVTIEGKAREGRFYEDSGIDLVRRIGSEGKQKGGGRTGNYKENNGRWKSLEGR